MRSTIHVVSAGDYWPFAVGTLRARREAWLRFQGKALDGIDMPASERRVRELLTERPRRHPEILKLLAAEGQPRIAWVVAAQLIDLVRVPPSGTWEQRRADLYGLAEEWLSRPDTSEEAAIERLVSCYLGGFGPAAPTEIANWAGLHPTAIQPAVEKLATRRFRDEKGKELVDLPHAPLPDPDTPAPARFLPTWDATLLVHARRTLILPERFRPLILHTKAPHSFPTFLVDGQVAGTWRYEKGEVQLQPFDPLPPNVTHAVEEEAERLAAWHA